MNQQEMQSIKRMIAAQVSGAMNNPEKVDTIRRDFFVYEAEALAIAPAGSANDNINIEADSDFILQKLTYQADIAAAAFTDSTRPIPNVNILITDSGSGRQLMSNPIPIPSIFGTGELPFILPNPRKFLRNSSIQIAFTNFGAAITYNIRLSLIGYKIYGTQ